MKFLLEWVEYGKTRSKEITLDEAVGIYEDNCSDWDLNGENMLYRSSQSGFDYSIIDPKNHTRPSRNTSNHYTMLMDKYLDSWNLYPNRSESVIMSSNSQSDQIKHMIPFNNSTIGVCSAVDIWFSFHEIISNLSLDNLNDDILSDLKMKNNDKVVNIGDLIISGSDDVEKYLHQYTYSDFEKNFLNENHDNNPRFESTPKYDTIRGLNKIWKKNKTISLYEMLNDFLLNPSINNFQLLSSKDYQNLNKIYNKECWSSDKFLIIKGTGGGPHGDDNWQRFKKLANGDT